MLAFFFKLFFSIFFVIIGFIINPRKTSFAIDINARQIFIEVFFPQCDWVCINQAWLYSAEFVKFLLFWILRRSLRCACSDFQLRFHHAMAIKIVWKIHSRCFVALTLLRRNNLTLCLHFYYESSTETQTFALYCDSASHFFK